MNRSSVAVQIVMLVSLVISVFSVQAESASTDQTTTAWDRVILEAAFSRIDANDDGLLSRAEASRLAAMGERFEVLDADHDDSLNLEEFSVGYTAPL